MKWLAFCFLLAAVLQACGSESDLTAQSKLDAPLRQRIADLSAKQSREELEVFIKSTVSLDSQSRSTLSNAGARIVGETGQVISARVSSDSIMSVARLEFVSSVQLSQQSKALTK